MCGTVDTRVVLRLAPWRPHSSLCRRQPSTSIRASRSGQRCGETLGKVSRRRVKRRGAWKQGGARAAPPPHSPPVPYKPTTIDYCTGPGGSGPAAEREQRERMMQAQRAKEREKREIEGDIKEFQVSFHQKHSRKPTKGDMSAHRTSCSRAPSVAKDVPGRCPAPAPAPAPVQAAPSPIA